MDVTSKEFIKLMTMQLNGLRDSIRVKLTAALNTIEHAEYKTPDHQTHPTLAVCTDTIDENGVPVLVVQAEKMNADDKFVMVFDMKITFDGQVYTIKDAVHRKDKVTDLHFVSELNAGGKIVVDHVVAKICYFIGATYR